VPWGELAFTRYLGEDRAPGRAHDASAVLETGRRLATPLLVDHGLADKFLEPQLRPERLEAAAATAGQILTLRRHAGYDHNYYFIATFVEDHLRHHAALLAA
jgi:S-formylglutathione hydrolase